MSDCRAGKGELAQIYRLMYRSRLFQEKLLELKKQGLLRGSFYPEIGEEAVNIGSLLAMEDGDIIHPYWRGEGVALQLRGLETRELMAWWLGKKGEGGTVRMVAPTSHADIRCGIIGRADGCLGSEMDMSVGAALASKLQKSSRVTLLQIGDGSTNRGNFHEALTFASIFKLPIVFVCRNNGWAMSMPVSRGVPITDIADRASSYGIPGVIVDGNDVLAVREQVRTAVERARRGLGPTLIEAKTYRLGPHSANDEDDYRSAEEKQEWAQKDPLIKLAQCLSAAGADQAELDGIRSECEQEIEDAFEWAMKRPTVPADEILAAQTAVVRTMWGRP